MSPLATRCLSALVLAPPVLAAIYFGPPYSDVLAIVCGALMGWEWARLCSHGQVDAAVVSAVCVALLVPALGAFGQWQFAIAALGAGAVVAAALARSGGGARRGWLFFGLLYVGLFCLAFLAIRARGWEPVFWLLLVVWATDIGAYFAGRGIGGPKLAPRISPNKTWAGLIGGMLSAGAVAALFALSPSAFGASLWMVPIAMCLAVLAQMGDLLESFYKRCYNAKDSSNLIPGHGGILDRADGLMAAALAMAGFMLVTKGAMG
jgi:phosphatidate cytidylyltransferase